MSLSLLERQGAAAGAAPPRRWWQAASRSPGSTLFVQEQAVWSYEAGADAAQRFASVDDWMQARAGANGRVVLSTALSHELVVSDPALPVHDAQSLQAWARHQFVHYHGPAAERWAMSVWLGGEQRGASAAHGIDLDELSRRAAAAGVRLRAVQPWWAVALQAATREAPTLALAAEAELWIVEARRGTRVRCAAGRVLQIDRHWLARADVGALAECMADSPAPVAASWVLGYGLGADGTGSLRVRCLGSLHGDHPAARWLGA